MQLRGKLHHSFQGADLKILVEAAAQFGQQFVVGAITDTQHTQAVILQFCAEFPVVSGEIRGNKHKILHTQLFFLYIIIQADGAHNVLPSYTTRASRG